MKKILIVCYTALALAFIVPLFLRAAPEEPSAAPVTVPGAAAPPIAADEPSPPPREVRETISVLVGDEPRELDMTDYLTGVVAAEMPASFEEEALRAQAVAARTYALYCAAAHRHADAEVCADSGCCQALLDDDAMRERLAQRLEAGACPGLTVRLLGPAPAAVAKVNNRYRCCLTLCARNCRALRELAAGALREFSRDRKNKGVFVSADVNGYG